MEAFYESTSHSGGGRNPSFSETFLHPKNLWDYGNYLNLTPFWFFLTLCGLASSDATDTDCPTRALKKRKNERYTGAGSVQWINTEVWTWWGLGEDSRHNAHGETEARGAQRSCLKLVLTRTPAFSLITHRGLQTISVEGQIINIFWGSHSVCYSYSALVCSVKAATRSTWMNGHGCAPVKFLYGHFQTASAPGSCSSAHHFSIYCA